MKRAVFGGGPSGTNVTLYEGPLRPISVKEGAPPAGAGETGEGIYIAWAANGAEPSTHDCAATLADFNLQLAPGDTRFVRVEIAPGAESAMHRTPHIHDYFVVLAGELTMRLEDGSSCLIEAGDMFVQLAGWHSWKNEGSEPFVMAGVVVGIQTEKQVLFGVEVLKGNEE